MLASLEAQHHRQQKRTTHKTVGTLQAASTPALGSSALDPVHFNLSPKDQFSSSRRRAYRPTILHHPAISTIWGSHRPQQGPFESDHGDKPDNMPLRGRLEEKRPSDALPLFPVCARRGLADSRGAVKQSVWHKVTSTAICMFQAVIPSLWLTGPAGADWKCAQPHNACLLSSACPKAEGLCYGCSSL